MTQQEYDALIAQAKRVDPINYMDVAHDHILTGKSMIELKYEYFTEKQADFTEIEETTKVCQKCNQIKSINEFPIVSNKLRKYVLNQCDRCDLDRRNKYQNNRRATDEEFRNMRVNATKEWRKKNPEKTKEYAKNRDADKFNEYRRQWREKNKERINAEQRARYKKEKAKSIN